MVTYGEELKVKIKSLGMTLTGFAGMAGVSRGYLSNIVNDYFVPGDTVATKIDNALDKLAGEFVPPDNDFDTYSEAVANHINDQGKDIPPELLIEAIEVQRGKKAAIDYAKYTPSPACGHGDAVPRDNSLMCLFLETVDSLPDGADLFHLFGKAVYGMMRADQ